jgi:hypothetical protein
MGIKKYIIASFLLFVIVAGYVFSVNQNEFTFNIPEIGLSYTLPVYIWSIVPAIILFIATLLHMFWYGTKGYFQRTTMEKDLAKIVLALESRLLKKESTVSFKTADLKEFNTIINQLELSASGNIDTSSSEIKNAVGILQKIVNKDYIQQKDLKLNSDNELYKKNIINRIYNDDNFAIEVLKNNTKYDEVTIEIAFDKALENKSVGTVKKAIESLTLSNQMVKGLLLKDSKSSKEMSFTNSEILELIQNNKFTNDDLIEIARNYKRTMSPEQLIKLFEDVAANDETLTPSYLYVLFEYEMVDDAREIIVNSQKDEFIIFKAMLDLRDAGKHYTLESLKFD